MTSSGGDGRAGRPRARHPRPQARPAVVAIVLAVAVTTVVTACGSETVTGSRLVSTTAPPAATWEPPVGRAVRIMPLGDSLTDGADPQRPTTSPQSYRGHLERLLAGAGYDVDLVGTQRRLAVGGTDPDHEGHSGFTIGPDDSTMCTGCGPANLDAGVDDWLAAADPDIVLLLVGVNDLLPAADPSTGLRRATEPGEAAGKLRRLVERLRAADPARPVVVASYPPVPFLEDPANPSAAAFRALNATARELGGGADPLVRYAPLHESLAGAWGATDVLTAVGDTLHPSAAGAERIAGIWFETLEPLLRAER